MKRVSKYIIMAGIIMGMYSLKNNIFFTDGQIVKSQDITVNQENWDELVVYHANMEDISLTVDGKKIDTDLIYMQKNMKLMMFKSMSNLPLQISRLK